MLRLPSGWTVLDPNQKEIIIIDMYWDNCVEESGFFPSIVFDPMLNRYIMENKRCMPLWNIDEYTVIKIMEFMNYHYHQQRFRISTSLDNYLDPWYWLFLETKSNWMVPKIGRRSIFLIVWELLELVCAKTVSLIQNKNDK